MYGALLGLAGMGLGMMGNQQQKGAQRRAFHNLNDATTRYNTRQNAYGDELTGNIDELAQQRRDQLTALLQSGAGPGRAQAGTDASALAGTQMNTALGQSRTALPWQGNQWANQESSAVSRLQGQQQDTTNQRIGEALKYGQASRGAQGLEAFDRQASNTYGNELVGIDRTIGQQQADTALRQAKLSQLWQQLGLRYGAGVNNAQYAGDNAKMLGQALMMGGTYVNSTQANQTPTWENSSTPAGYERIYTTSAT